MKNIHVYSPKVCRWSTILTSVAGSKINIPWSKYLIVTVFLVPIIPSSKVEEFPGGNCEKQCRDYYKSKSGAHNLTSNDTFSFDCAELREQLLIKVCRGNCRECPNYVCNISASPDSSRYNCPPPSFRWEKNTTFRQQVVFDHNWEENRKKFEKARNDNLNNFEKESSKMRTVAYISILAVIILPLAICAISGCVYCCIIAQRQPRVQLMPSANAGYYAPQQGMMMPQQSFATMQQESFQPGTTGMAANAPQQQTFPNNAQWGNPPPYSNPTSASTNQS